MSEQQAAKAWARAQLLTLAEMLLPEGSEITDARALGASDATLASLYPPATTLEWIRALDEFLIGGELEEIDLDAPGAVLAGYLALSNASALLRQIGPAEPTTDVLVQDAYARLPPRGTVPDPTDVMVIVLNLLRGLASPASGGLAVVEAYQIDRFVALVETTVKIVTTPQRAAARARRSALSLD